VAPRSASSTYLLFGYLKKLSLIDLYLTT